MAKKLFVTDDESRIWLNTTECTGICFALCVWLTTLFAAAVTILVVIEGEMAVYNGAIILTLVVLALWSHLRTMMADPGAVPANAHPLVHDIEISQIVCGRCECYKPLHSHHGELSLFIITL